MSNPTPQPPQARLGWVSPDGDYYPCGYCAHTDLADILLRCHYEGGGMGGRWDLEKRGWIGIMSEGLYGIASEHNPTERQRATLLAVLEAFELAPNDTDWDAVLLDNPEDYDVQQWMSLPNSSGRIVQKMRDCYELYCERRPRHRLIPPTDDIVIKRIGDHPGD